MRALLRRLRTEQSGLSMTEVLVASMLTTVILIMVTSMFISLSKITTATVQTRNSNGVAANVANEITSVLRVATTLAKSNTVPDPAIVSGTRSSIQLYAFANTSASDPAPVRITFTLDASGNVIEDRCVGTISGGYWSFGSCASSSSRNIGAGVLAPTGVSDQLFTYLDANGAPIVIGTGALSAADRAKVASIIVIVRARAAGSSNDPVLITNTVVLRNLGLDSGS